MQMEWPSSVLNLIVIILIRLIFNGIDCYLQELILHESVEQDRNSFRFRSHIPDATIYPLSNVKLACVRGFWDVFEQTHFEGSRREFVGLENVECYNMTVNFKSFRFGGCLETTENWLSLYAMEDFKGPETLVTGLAMAMLAGKSVRFTGTSSWLFFEGQNFNGTRTSISHLDQKIKESEITGYSNVTQQLNLSRVGSVLRGCPIHEVKCS